MMQALTGFGGNGPAAERAYGRIRRYDLILFTGRCMSNGGVTGVNDKRYVMDWENQPEIIQQAHGYALQGWELAKEWLLSPAAWSQFALLVVAAAWLVFRLIDLASGYLASRAERTASKFDDVLIPLISTIAKIVGILMGILICAETFNFNVNTLLGGLGIGGMALALASKDAVSNLFGSFTVLIDRPFEIGDWVITEDIEGTVEQVGFRSTRIRTFYNSLITLPNSRLTTAVVDNMGRRRYRRVKAVLGVQYSTTPDQLDAFCEGIRELIRRSSATRKDYFHV